jgi:hypothetical protein
MTVILPMRQAGVRRLVVDFDAGFGSCTAKVSFAKQAGASTSTAFSPITKKMVELQSIITSGESCTVRSGNVFDG